MAFLDALIIFLAISFVYYGLACLFSQKMVGEFERYGVPRFRLFIGMCEVLGALGLLVGFYQPVLQIISAGGLALLMLAGCMLRVKIRDSLAQTAPAFVFLLLSLFVLFELKRH